MPAPTGSYSRDMFPSSRRKQYVKGRMQEGTEVADADGNDNTDLMYEKLRVFIEKLGGSSFFFDTAFEVSGDGTNNDFQVGLGSGFVGGHEAYLGLDSNYASSGADQEDVNLHSISTGISATVLTDTSMNWTVNELVGRELFPDLTSGTSFTVLSNTATTVTTLGDMTSVAASGDSYYVALSTPSGSDRDDSVWLNLYLDEIDSGEDPSLLHNLGSGIELDLRTKVRTILQVEQGAATYSDYTDTDGNLHHLVKIATLNRLDGNLSITGGMVQDDRPVTTAQGGSVKVSGADLTSGTLSQKIVAGAGITLSTLNPGADEDLEISASGTDELVKASGADTTPGNLSQKIVAGSNVTLALLNPGADETLEISSTGGGGAVSPLEGLTFVPQPETEKVVLLETFASLGGDVNRTIDFSVAGTGGQIVTPPVGATHAICNLELDVDQAGGQGNWVGYLQSYKATPSWASASLITCFLSGNHPAGEFNITNSGMKIVPLNTTPDPTGDIMLYVNRAGTQSGDLSIRVAIEGWYIPEDAASASTETPLTGKTFIPESDSIVGGQPVPSGVGNILVGASTDIGAGNVDLSGLTTIPPNATHIQIDLINAINTTGMTGTSQTRLWVDAIDVATIPGNRAASNLRWESDTPPGQDLLDTRTVVIPINQTAPSFYWALATGAGHTASVAGVAQFHWKVSGFFIDDTSLLVLEPSSPISFRTTKNVTEQGGTPAYISLWDVVEYNTGTGFNPTTGIFTAPIEGDYQFNLNVGFQNLTSPGSTIAASLVKNGAVVLATNAMIQYIAENYPVLPVSASCHLAAGDTVRAQASTNNGGKWGSAGNNTSFDGYLVASTLPLLAGAPGFYLATEYTPYKTLGTLANGRTIFTDDGLGITSEGDNLFVDMDSDNLASGNGYAGGPPTFNFADFLATGPGTFDPTRVRAVLFSAWAGGSLAGVGVHVRADVSGVKVVVAGVDQGGDGTDRDCQSSLLVPVNPGQLTFLPKFLMDTTGVQIVNTGVYIQWRIIGFHQY